MRREHLALLIGVAMVSLVASGCAKEDKPASTAETGSAPASSAAADASADQPPSVADSLSILPVETAAMPGSSAAGDTSASDSLK